MRLTIIFDNFGPYHLARVGAAAKRMEVTGVELRARSKTYSWQSPEEAGFRKVTLPAVGGHGRAERLALVSHLEKALRESRPDVVAVNGWGDYLAAQSIRWCMRNKVPFVLLSESSALDGPSSRLRNIVKRRLIGMAAAAFVGGKPHRAHLIDLGMPPDRIFTGYNVVDNRYFAEKTQDYKRQDAREEREQAEGGGQESEVGIIGPRTKNQEPSTLPFFLASNRFIERKNLARLIEAYSSYIQKSKFNNHQSSIWHLCLLGDGELKADLIAKCHELGLQVIESAPWESTSHTSKIENQQSTIVHQRSDSSLTSDLRPPTSGLVFFPGFRQIDELPRFYAHAGCFIHPSMVEPWGLVVNEAMACGLPVLVSDRCGCASDLVDPGVNGYTFSPEDVDQLASLMCRISAPEFPLCSFGAASRRIVEKWSPEDFASGLEAAGVRALAHGAKCPTAVDLLLLHMLCAIR